MKSTGDVRRFLLEQMTAVAEGTADLEATKAVSNLAQQVYNTINLEIKVASAKAKFGDDVQINEVVFDASDTPVDS